MEGFSYIAICQIAEGFGKRSVVPNGIRRGGFAHSRKTASFKAFKLMELAVFLEWAKPPLRIPFGTTLRFPNPSAI